jgi:hypothetical protein
MPRLSKQYLRLSEEYLGGCLKSLICNPKACRGVAFGQEFWVYSRVYLPNATPLQGTFATFQTPSYD